MSLNTLNHEANTHKDKIKSQIFDVLSAEITNTENVKRLIKKTEFGLFGVLGSDELVVDYKVKKQVLDVKKKLGEMAGTLYQEIDNERLAEGGIDGTGGKVAIHDVSYRGETVPYIRAGHKRDKDIAYANWKKYDSLLKSMGSGTGSENINRKKEYTMLNSMLNKFADLNILSVDKMGAVDITTNMTRDIKNDFLGVLDTKMHLQSKLLNSDGSNVEKLGDKKYKVKLKNKDGAEKTYVIDGLELISKSDGSELKLEFHPGLKIYEADGKTLAGDIDFSKDISLGLKNIVSHNDLTQKVSHAKMLNFKIKPEIDTLVEKKTIFDDLNATGNITRGLELSYDNYFKQLEEEAFLDVFQKRGMGNITSLSSEEKKDLIKFIKGTIATFDHDKAHVVVPDDFRDTFLLKKKELEKCVYSKSDYTGMILSDIQNDMKSYMKDYVKKSVQNHDLEIKSLLPEFFTKNLEKEKNPEDNHLDRKKLSTFMKTHIDKKISKDLKKDNYLKFFVGENYALSNQKISLGDKEVNYGMDLSVLSPNSFQLKLQINGEEKIILGNSHLSLIDNILNSYDIPEGKVRLHIAYNIYKSMIAIAQKSGISLTTKNKTIRKTLSLKGNDICLKQSKFKADRTSTDTNIFDEKEFQKSNDMSVLLGGLKKTSVFFHEIMQENYVIFRKATKWKFLGNRNTQTRLPSRWLFSPIKKLLNKKENINFDFEKTVKFGDDEYQIKFEKNKFIIQVGDKKYTNFDLAKILNKSVFRGMEKKLFGEVYKELVVKLRENPKVKSKDFFVVDELKSRTYILNKDGKIGYINKENKEIVSRNNQKKGRGIVKNESYSMTLLDNVDELYQDPYLMGNLVKTMNEQLSKIR